LKVKELKQFCTKIFLSQRFKYNFANVLSNKMQIIPQISFFGILPQKMDRFCNFFEWFDFVNNPRYCPEYSSAICGFLSDGIPIRIKYLTKTSVLNFATLS
jgi:hypothetical protein